LCADTIDFLSHFNNTLNSPSTPPCPGTHTCPPSLHPRPITAPVSLPLPPRVHVRARVWFSQCPQCLPLFDCHSLAWVHGKPAVYFLTLTGYLCRHPTPVQPPPGPSQQGDVLAPGDNGKLSSFFTIHASGFVCRHDNDTLHDTPHEDNSRHTTTHGATTVQGRLTT